MHPRLLPFLTLLLLTSPLLAQVPRPGHAPASMSQPPAFSPYLNLLRRGTSPALNYYGLVRPQVEFNNSLQNLQQNQTTLGQQVNNVEQEVALPTTGHTVQFQNHLVLFNTLARGTAGRPSTPTSATLPRAPTSPQGGGQSR